MNSRWVVILITTFALTGCVGPVGKAKTAIDEYREGDMVAAEHGALFYGVDVLAAPGESVELVARLQTPHRLRGIANVLVAFDDGKQRLGTAITNEDGIARLRYTAPRQVCDRTITIQPTWAPRDVLDDVGKVTKCRYELLLAVREPSTPFIVVDLDHTVVDEGFYRVLTDNDPREMEQSNKVLQRLARDYSVIYLTQRPDVLTRKSKLWLVENKFPPGVLMTCGLKESIGDTAEVKSRHLRRLRSRWGGVCIGIGDREGDCQAYLQNAMIAYVIPDCGRNGGKRRQAVQMLRKLPPTQQVQAVRNWRQIEEGITQRKRFAADSLAAELEAQR